MQIKKQLLMTKIIHSRIGKMRMMLYKNLQPHLVQEDVNEASSTDIEAKFPQCNHRLLIPKY